MQPEHTGEQLFGRRVIRPNKNHTNTMLKFNVDSQFHVPKSIILHFLHYYTSWARILFPVVPTCVQAIISLLMLCPKSLF